MLNKNIFYEEIEKGWGTACLSDQLVSNERYRPSLISNNYREGKKVLPIIEQELSECQSFIISVAFITLSGIEPMLMLLKDLQRRGIPGKILTTDYLVFSEPKALDKLSEFSNIDLRVYKTGNGEGFHTKGYIFEKESINVMIIGSSNITASALTRNKEWNTRLVGTRNGELSKGIIAEYESLWNDEKTVPYDSYAEEYRLKYRLKKEQERTALKSQVVDLETYRLEPNSMQLQFIKNVKKLKEEGAKRILLVSATGDCVIIVTGCKNVDSIRLLETFTKNKTSCIA